MEMKIVEETRTTNEKCCSRRLGGERQPQQRTQQLLINIFRNSFHVGRFE